MIIEGGVGERGRYWVRSCCWVLGLMVWKAAFLDTYLSLCVLWSGKDEIY